MRYRSLVCACGVEVVLVGLRVCWYSWQVVLVVGCEVLTLGCAFVVVAGVHIRKNDEEERNQLNRAQGQIGP